MLSFTSSTLSVGQVRLFIYCFQFRVMHVTAVRPRPQPSQFPLNTSRILCLSYTGTCDNSKHYNSLVSVRDWSPIYESRSLDDLIRTVRSRSFQEGACTPMLPPPPRTPSLNQGRPSVSRGISTQDPWRLIGTTFFSTDGDTPLCRRQPFITPGILQTRLNLANVSGLFGIPGSESLSAAFSVARRAWLSQDVSYTELIISLLCHVLRRCFPAVPGFPITKKTAILSSDFFDDGHGNSWGDLYADIPVSSVDQFLIPMHGNDRRSALLVVDMQLRSMTVYDFLESRYPYDWTQNKDRACHWLQRQLPSSTPCFTTFFLSSKKDVMQTPVPAHGGVSTVMAICFLYLGRNIEDMASEFNSVGGHMMQQFFASLFLSAVDAHCGTYSSPRNLISPGSFTFLRSSSISSDRSWTISPNTTCSQTSESWPQLTVTPNVTSDSGVTVHNSLAGSSLTQTTSAESKGSSDGVLMHYI